MGDTLHYLHPDDVGAYLKAKDLCYRLANYVGKRCVFEAKRRPLEETAYGQCWVDEVPPRITIVFRFKQRKVDGGKWLSRPESYVSVAHTVAHEVAHLVHPNHSKEFRKLEKELISVANGLEGLPC